MWRPDTLLEHPELATVFATDRHGRYQCPNCRVFRVAACIVDVRHLPIAEEWACDCCWTQWERTGRVIDGGGPMDAANKFDWRRRWVIVHGAPQSIVGKFRA